MIPYSLDYAGGTGYLCDLQNVTKVISELFLFSLQKRKGGSYNKIVRWKYGQQL